MEPKFKKGQRVMILSDTRVELSEATLGVSKGMYGIVESVVGGMYSVRFELAHFFWLTVYVPEVGLSE